MKVVGSLKDPEGKLQNHCVELSGESVALSLAIPMSMILDTLLDNDACNLAFLVAGAFMG